ncbi:hypothetical protein GRW89_06415 [Pseudomonas moraviensis]|uniref:hypothetical protein n=1 Tax=Pseudomonas moraviensis TaxID=321662 RepID=UPI00135EEF8F|nr:hypothetical protein [Pseudomonas moraviensis]MXI46137.1 hypothetical protein [Pseudomonas moraviensis]
MAIPKFCVFCGGVPEAKNKEHVLPQWLIKMTGNPRRVVKIGFNYKAQKEISFDWTSLVMPACEACNTEFSELEGVIRPLIEVLLQRGELYSKDYFALLDWLDKVRVGLWLNYHLLQGNPTGIEPSFYIKSRLRKKDRFLAIYPIEDSAKGLNAKGVETLAFHRAPSVFGLRINNIFIVNCSSDYLFSARCGFPHPSKMEIVLDGEDVGLMQMGAFSSTKKLKHPLLRFSLYMPSVFVFQPIMQQSISDSLVKGEKVFLGGDPLNDTFLIENTFGAEYPGVGKLFRQFKDKVVRLDDNQLVEFDSIKGLECKSVGLLVSQVYALQLHLQRLYLPLARKLDARAQWNALQKAMEVESKAIIRDCVRRAN